VVKGNAAQGTMGFPFAIEKMPTVKEIIAPIQANLVKEFKDAVIMQKDISSQDTKLSASTEFTSPTKIKAKAQTLSQMVSDISEIEHQIELYKENEKDPELEQMSLALKPIISFKTLSESVEHTEQKSEEDNMIAFSEYQASSNSQFEE